MRSIERLIFFVVAIFFLTSCGNPKKDNGNFSDDSFKKVYHLTDGILYKNDSLFIGHPLWMKYHPDSFLVLQDYQTPELIKIIDLKNNHIQSMIPEGRGPGEMLVGWGIEIIDKDIYAFGAQLNKVIVLSPDDDRKFFISGEFGIDVKLVMEFCPLKKDLFASLCAADEQRLTLLDGDGKIIRKTGDFPSFQSSSNIKGDNDIFQSGMIGSPDGNIIALACRSTDVIEIYDVKKDEFKRIQGPKGIRLTVIDQGIAKSLEPRFDTYMLLSACEDEFWVSYNGYKSEKGEQIATENQLPKQIFCFDWKGRPLRKILLDYPFGGFDIDWKNKILYTLELRDNYPHIVKYQIDTIFK